jgi:hypothetical protein
LKVELSLKTSRARLGGKGDQVFRRWGFHIRLSHAGLRMESDKCAGEAYLIFELNYNEYM